ncbi:MAG: peptidylprolyl isomerase [Verrucomicrobia bacterium]|nr:peptidylprolyl isomerase [Verrucomicrobiota bacterium]
MKTLLATLLAPLSLLGAEPAPVLGRIGDIELTTAELRETIAGLEPEQAAALSKDAAALEQYARALLVQRMVLKKATDDKWDQQPAVIARLVRARETALTESYLEKVSAPASDYPSEADITEAYDKNREALRVPKSYQLAQIYLADDRPAGSPAPAALAPLEKRLKAKNADFPAIAKTSSEDAATAANGGLIGWLTENQVQPEIRARLPKLGLGEITDPIRMNDGWHIIKVLDIREAHTPTLDQVRSQLVARLREERARANRQRYLAELLKDHPLAINGIELSGIPQKTSK